MPSSHHQHAAQSARTSSSRKPTRPSIARDSATNVLQRAQADPQSLNAADIQVLQRTIGNRATGHFISSRINIQPKLKLGPADDQYEREADAVAQQVVQRVAATDVQRGGPSSEHPMQTPVAERASLVNWPAPIRRRFDASMLQRDVLNEEIDGKMAQASPLHGLKGGDVNDGISQTIERERGRGQQMDGEVRRKMEQGFGATFGGVRIHQGGKADALNRSLNARAFTSGNDIFFGKGEYQPSSTSGQELLAHELTHTVQQGSVSLQRSSREEGAQIAAGKMPSNRISTKKKAMHLDFVKMKREDPDFSRIIKKKLGIAVENQGGGGTYGHWWTEVGDGQAGGFRPRESYGWWPNGDDAPTGKRLWGGVEGALNGEGPSSRRDPHQEDDAPVEFHPTMNVDLTKESYDEIKTRVSAEIRDFAQNYTGKWSWKLGWGKNCHTFQQKLKKEVGLHNQKSKHWLVNPAIQEAEDDRERASDEVKGTFVVPEGRTLAMHSPEDGSDLPGGIRGGTTVGATGKVIEVQTRFAGKELLFEYVVNGNRYWVSQIYWEMWFGPGSYPTEDSTPQAEGANDDDLILRL